MSLGAQRPPSIPEADPKSNEADGSDDEPTRIGDHRGGSLSNHRTARCRRDGRRVSGRARAHAQSGGLEDPPPRAHLLARGRGSVRTGSGGRGPHRAPQRGHGERLRSARQRVVLSRARVRRGREPPGASRRGDRCRRSWHFTSGVKSPPRSMRRMLQGSFTAISSPTTSCWCKRIRNRPSRRSWTSASQKSSLAMPRPGSPRRARYSARRSTWRRNKPPALRSTLRADLYTLGIILYEMLSGTTSLCGQRHGRGAHPPDDDGSRSAAPKPRAPESGRW